MPRHYRRIRHVKTPNRILLHLSLGGHPIPPPLEAFTQEGIAGAVRSGRPTVTKWVARLEAEGLLASERMRLPSYPLPRTVYRLTDAGVRQAERILAQLGSEVVEIRAPTLETVSVRLADVPGIAPAPLDLAAAAALVERGRIQFDRGPVRATRADGYLLWGPSLRQVDRFFGRGWELRSLDAWMASPSRVLVVTGLPGIGKSALVAEWIRRHRPASHVFVFHVQESTTAAGFLSEFGAFLDSLGHHSLATQMAQEGPLDVGLVERLLPNELARMRILVVLDGFERASRDLSALAWTTLLRLARETSLRLVVVSRSTPQAPLRRRADAMAIELLTLQGLQAEDAEALLRHRGVAANSPTLGEIVRLAAGHPLLLHLAAQGGTTDVSAVRGYFRTLWDGLGTDERAILETACVVRRPVAGKVLAAAARVRIKAVEALRAKNLLERTLAGRYLVHDIVREAVRDRVGGSRLVRCHGRLAGPLLREEDARDRWEGVYHLLEAGRVAEASRFLDSEGAPLLDSAAAEEITAILLGSHRREADAHAECVLAEVAGDGLRVLGHIGPAAFQYDHARRRAETLESPERVARILRKMAFLERCRNRYARALGYLVEARARLSQTPPSRETGEVLRELALVQQAQGNLGEAAGYFGEALDLATDASDWPALSRALLALGSLETQRGNRELGLDYNLEGLRIAERSRNLTELARAHIVVGTGLAELGRLEESIPHYEQGLQLARMLGNLRLSAYALMNRTGALIDLGRYAEAGSALREARGYFEILEERDTLGLLRIYEGTMEEGLGRWARAKRSWEEGLVILRKHGSPPDLARALKVVGGSLVAHGESEEGESYLREALAIAETLGNATLLSEIREAFGRIHGGPPAADSP